MACKFSFAGVCGREASSHSLGLEKRGVGNQVHILVGIQRDIGAQGGGRGVDNSIDSNIEPDDAGKG